MWLCAFDHTSQKSSFVGFSNFDHSFFCIQNPQKLINARPSLGNHANYDAISIAHRIAINQPRSITHPFVVSRDQDRGPQPTGFTYKTFSFECISQANPAHVHNCMFYSLNFPRQGLHFGDLTADDAPERVASYLRCHI